MTVVQPGNLLAEQGSREVPPATRPALASVIPKIYRLNYEQQNESIAPLDVPPQFMVSETVLQQFRLD
jgi:hypothetical protein